MSDTLTAASNLVWRPRSINNRTEDNAFQCTDHDGDEEERTRSFDERWMHRVQEPQAGQEQWMNYGTTSEHGVPKPPLFDILWLQLKWIEHKRTRGD